MDKDYLGDSVYAELDHLNRIVLTTENGLPHDPSNIIILEPEVIDAFVRFIGLARQVVMLRREATQIKTQSVEKVDHGKEE